MSMEKLVVVIPAYNEYENIPDLIKNWYLALEKAVEDKNEFLIVVIDDGSKDQTYEVLCSLKKEYNRLIPIKKKNEGHGATVLYGYRYALKNGADWIFQTDSDGQTNPGEFDSFWKKRHEYSAIIGNRTVRGDGKSRAFVEWVVCMLLRIYFGIRVPDANAPFRLMSKELVSKYIEYLPKDYFLPNIMMTAFFSFYGENILFKEISFKPRQAGVNTINIKRITQIGWKAAQDFHRFREYMKK